MKLLKHVRFHKYIVFSIILLSFLKGHSQYEPRGEKYNYKDAVYFMDNNNYFDALYLFKKLAENNPEIDEYKWKTGICYAEIKQEPRKAIQLLKGYEQGHKYEHHILFHLGKSYMLINDYDKALECFEKSHKTKSLVDYNYKNEIPRYIEQCKHGNELLRDSLIVDVYNLTDLNTIHNEYRSIVTKEGKSLFYTYCGNKSTGGRMDIFFHKDERGNFYPDIYKAGLKDGEVENVEKLKGNVNTKFVNELAGLKDNGESIFEYLDIKNLKGEIYQTTQRDTSWLVSGSLGLNSIAAENCITLFSDGKKMIFSSNRSDGFGGLDLYVSIKGVDSLWSEPVNLGSKINTPYDDDAPFIVNDSVLYFSSTGHSSLGGYDIFSTVITDVDTTKAVNIGYPINTAGDDHYFSVTTDEIAYFSSNRPGGSGQYDLYSVNINNLISHRQALIDTLALYGVLYNKLPGDLAELLDMFIIDENGNVIYSIKTNKDGTFSFKNLPSDGVFRIKLADESDVTMALLDADGNRLGIGQHLGNGIYEIIKEKEEALSTQNLNKVNESNGDAGIEQTANTSNTGDLQKGVTDLPTLKITSYADMLDKVGNVLHLDLEYRIQIGAFFNPENYTRSYINDVGKLDKYSTNEGITHFTVGHFDSLKKVDDKLKTVKAKGHADAFVVIFLNGKRTNKANLIDKGIYK
jgi:tetratricopeptide (TPR) repeat protein